MKVEQKTQLSRADSAEGTVNSSGLRTLELSTTGVAMGRAIRDLLEGEAMRL
jgi:hypothetical protein